MNLPYSQGSRRSSDFGSYQSRNVWGDPLGVFADRTRGPETAVCDCPCRERRFSRPYSKERSATGDSGCADPIEGLYLSVTCAGETLRIAASDIGPDSPEFLGSDRLVRQMTACRAWPQSSAAR